MSSDAQNDSTTIIPSSAVAPLVGKTLNNRFLIERELKRGGFGVVYLAKDLQLHSRIVVVKILLEESYQSEYVVQKFHQESEALSRIDHPGVVGIIDAGELSDGKPFIVMQYVDGVTLRSVIKPEGMAMKRVGDIVRQIGRALTAAHDKGIFHRDLKPENVMLQDLGHGEEQVKVIDFGIAKVKDSVIGQTTDTNVAIGTVSYMSPEQLSAKPVSAATDVYALAEIAYEMLCGRKPFNPETGFELLGLQREGVRVNPIDLRPGLPLEAQTAILRALSFDPKDRHSSARDFGDNLAQALSLSEDTSASAPAPTVVATEMTPMPDPSADKRNPDPTIAATIPIIQPTDRLVDGPQTKGNRLSMRLIVVVGLLGLLGVGGTFGAWHLYQKSLINSSNEGPPIGTERHLNFWLTVQKMRDGKPYQDPFDSSGQEIFEDGWKFRMNLSSPEVGYLYLLNEGPSEGGEISLTILFPNPFANAGSPYASSNQQIQTGWMVFNKSQGTENFWVVWSANPIAELEAVKGVVNNIDKGSIKDANQADAVRKFLSTSRPTAEARKDSEKKQTNLKASGSQIVHRIELEHH